MQTETECSRNKVVEPSLHSDVDTCVDMETEKKTVTTQPQQDNDSPGKVLMPPPPTPSPLQVIQSSEANDQDEIITNTVEHGEPDIFAELLNCNIDNTGCSSKPVHCSIAANPIKCTTTCIPPDNYTQQFIRKQIRKKMYEASEAIDQVNSKENSKVPTIKVDEDHFRRKNLNIEEIEVECLHQPIRCSTPTPGGSVLDATIMAGSLKIQRGKNDTLTVLDMNNDFDEDLPQMLCVPETPEKLMGLPVEEDKTFEEWRNPKKTNWSQLVSTLIQLRLRTM